MGHPRLFAKNPISTVTARTTRSCCTSCLLKSAFGSKLLPSSECTPFHHVKAVSGIPAKVVGCSH